MQPNDFLFFLPFVLAFFLIWGYMKKRMRKQQRLNEIWREFAGLKGLQEQPTDHDTILSFRGKIQGMPFVLECIATEGTPVQIGKLKMRRGDKIKIFTRMKVGLADLPEGLRVYPETAWSKLGKAIGMQDITTGDASFDNSFLIEGNDPKEVLDYLTPSRRMALLTYTDELHGLELRKEGLVLLQPGQADSVDRLSRYFSQLDLLASALIGS
jgi:hypothetical protein